MLWHWEAVREDEDEEEDKGDNDDEHSNNNCDDEKGGDGDDDDLLRTIIVFGVSIEDEDALARHGLSKRKGVVRGRNFLGCGWIIRPTGRNSCELTYILVSSLYCIGIRVQDLSLSLAPRDSLSICLHPVPL